MGEVRMVTGRDAGSVQRLLNQRPIHNIHVASKVRAEGLSRRGVGNGLLGYWEGRRLVSLLWNGFSLQPVNASEAALEAFSQRIDYRHCGSITGARDEAIGLWQRLCQRSYSQWASPREVRDHQRVMAISRDSKVAPDPRVEVVTTRNLGAYHKAAVAMYTEELGVAPVDPHGAYRDHVASLMIRGLTLGVMQDGHTVFKADVVASAGSVCQVGGVWLAPQLRGKGFSESMMSAVVAHCRQQFGVVSLYVNSHNWPAVACYQAVGFSSVGDFATVLY